MNLSYHESRARSGSVICNTKLKFDIIAIKWGESTHFPGRIDSLSGANR